MVLPVVALVGTNNLSTAVIILGIAVIVVFVSDKRYIQFVWMGALGIGVVAVFLGMESYRLERLAIWKIRKHMRKDIRRYRDCMRSVPVAYLAEGWVRAYRSLDLFRKHKMT